jgi:cyclopropane fatty-acyl-phospholipid synthase-like methyltransferase
MRIDHQLAEKWIKPDSSVLDLGCGDGELLAHMSKKHNIRAYGLEIDQEKIAIADSFVKIGMWRGAVWAELSLSCYS